jgi:hypothetical protein
VVRDEANGRWLLYSTGGGRKVDGRELDEVYVSTSTDLLEWKFVGVCALFPKLEAARNYGPTIEGWQGAKGWLGTTESMVILRHPLAQRWIMMGNWHYVLSDDPLDFMRGEVRHYDNRFQGKRVDLGFACEIVQHEGRWYRSATVGDLDYWKLGLTEIEWVKDGAFRIVAPGKRHVLY